MRTALLAARLAFVAWNVAALPAVGRATTIEDRVGDLVAAARQRLAPHFAAARLTYPPAQVVLVGLKAERRLELYAAGSDGRLHRLRSYPVLAASGTLGPKLREGDRQVP